MELAIIPPVAYLDHARRFKYQLALPHVFANDKDYAKYFLTMSESKHIILDNGAAEKEQYTLKQLIPMASLMRAKEMAIPDIMGDARGTYELAKESISELWKDWEMRVNVYGINLGYVVQGEDATEAISFLELLMEGKFGVAIDVVYIPRLLVTRSKPDTRVQMAKTIHKKYPHLQIHLFGASQNYLGDIPTASCYPFIRSIDTSAPYTFAHRGRHIDRGWYNQAIKRPRNYFYTKLPHSLEDIALKNVKTVERWCNESKAPTG